MQKKLTISQPTVGTGKTPHHQNSTQNRRSGRPFSSFVKCRPEVADDVISDGGVEKYGVDERAKFGIFALNVGRVIHPTLCPTAPFLRNFVQYLIQILQPTVSSY